MMFETIALALIGVSALYVAVRCLGSKSKIHPLDVALSIEDEPLIGRTRLRGRQNLVSWSLDGTYDENKLILIDADRPTRALSKKQIIDLVTRLAGSFDHGSSVNVHMANDILYPVLVLAILASGCCWTGTNPAYTAVELEHHLNSAQASYIVTSEEHLDIVGAAVASSSREIEIVLFSDIVSDMDNQLVEKRFESKPWRNLHDLLNYYDGQSLEARLATVPDFATAVIMSTSGTTGLPKMIQRSHRALILETAAGEDANDLKPYQVRRLYCTPMFHAFSFPEMVVNSLRLGFPSFYMRRFDDSFHQKVFDFQITETMAAPPILARLADQALRHQRVAEQLQSLRMTLCAGAALSSELRARFVRIFHNPMRVVQVWGMSEGGWFATFKFPEDDETGSVGRAIAGYQVRLCANSSVSVTEQIQASELLVRAPQMTRGYMGDKEATAEAFDSEGWMRTGDIGYVEKGKIYLIDRAKDMIKVNGWSVSPAELEAALHKNPKIQDAAVVGIAKGIEEHPMAFVVLKDNNTDPTEITTGLLQYVARYKAMTCEIRMVESIPRNPSGKILRKILRQQAEQERLTKAR